MGIFYSQAITFYTLKPTIGHISCCLLWYCEFLQSLMICSCIMALEIWTGIVRNFFTPVYWKLAFIYSMSLGFLFLLRRVTKACCLLLFGAHGISNYCRLLSFRASCTNVLFSSHSNVVIRWSLATSTSTFLYRRIKEVKQPLHAIFPLKRNFRFLGMEFSGCMFITIIWKRVDLLIEPLRWGSAWD